MSRTPTKQLATLFDRIHTKPNYWVKSKNYEAYWDEKTDTVMLSHYGTLIFSVSGQTYDYDFGGAYSVSDRDAINSFARLMGMASIASIRNYRLDVQDPWLAKYWVLADDGDLGVYAHGTYDEEGQKAVKLVWFQRPDTWPCGVCTDVAWGYVYLADDEELKQTVQDLNAGHDPVKEGWPGVCFENAMKVE